MLIRKMWTPGFVLLVALAVAGCGGGGDSSETVNAGAEDEAEATPSSEAPAVESTPVPTPVDGETPGDAAAIETPTPDDGRYATAYDPNATYTMDDVTMQGSYLKINLGDLSADQLNRVIHRMRSEVCTCGCPNDPIDQCLINDPACGTAVSLTNQIIREEKAKG